MPITAIINNVFISFSAVQLYDISYIDVNSSLSTVILRIKREFTTWSALSWLDRSLIYSSVGRALQIMGSNSVRA